MWEEYNYTYEERAEYFKDLIFQLEEEITQLKKENEQLREKLKYFENSYHENYSYINDRGIKIY